MLEAAQRYCSFWLCNECFGVPARAIKEVHGPTPITPIPGAPPSVSGYVNLRGQLYLVLDPRKLLTGEIGAGDEGQLLVFQATEGEAFAIRASRIGEIAGFAADQIDLPKNQDMAGRSNEPDLRPARLVTGYAKLERFIVTLVEPRELLAAAFHTSPVP
jgi:purine-binding chemotaxis protein CheW